MGHGWGMAGGVWMALFWVALILLVVYLVRSGSLTGWGPQRSPDPPGRDEAMDIVRQRFARGEIDFEEFERRKTALERHGPDM